MHWSVISPARVPAPDAVAAEESTHPASAPVGAPAGIDSLAVIGFDHRTLPDEVRERLFVDDADVPSLVSQLRSAGVGEVLPLSTCDRVEVAIVDSQPTKRLHTVVEALCNPVGLPAGELVAGARMRLSAEAVVHLFRITASLDSQIVGEPQILGQVRAAHKLARREGSVGPVLEAVLQAAYASAKRARTETTIAEGPVSMIAVAVDLVRSLHGDLDGCHGALVGTGDMGVLLAERMLDSGLSSMTVVDRNARRAEAAARELNANHITIADLAEAMARADVLVTAVGGGRHVIDEAVMAATLKRRRRRPVMVIDLGIPSDVDPAVERLEDAYVYDLDDLERAALEGKATRTVAAREAEDLVAGEVSRFLADRASREAVPAIRQLRATFEGLRQGVLLERGDADAESATDLLTKRLLHRPSTRLRRIAAEDPALAERLEEAVRLLFDTDEEDDR